MVISGNVDDFTLVAVCAFAFGNLVPLWGKCELIHCLMFFVLHYKNQLQNVSVSQKLLLATASMHAGWHNVYMHLLHVCVNIDVKAYVTTFFVSKHSLSLTWMCFDRGASAHQHLVAALSSGHTFTSSLPNIISCDIQLLLCAVVQLTSWSTSLSSLRHSNRLFRATSSCVFGVGKVMWDKVAFDCDQEDYSSDLANLFSKMPGKVVYGVWQCSLLCMLWMYCS